MSTFDLNDVHTQSSGLHSLLWSLYEASTDLDYASDNAPAVAAANRVSSLLILARDESERLDANIGECIMSQNRERNARNEAAPVAPQVEGGPIFDPAKLSMDELFGLYAAMKTVSDVACGLSCQPKFYRGKDLSPSGEMMDKLCTFFAEVTENIRDEATRRAPATANERDQKFFFAADQFVDGSCSPEYAMSGLKKELAKIGGQRNG